MKSRSDFVFPVNHLYHTIKTSYSLSTKILFLILTSSLIGQTSIHENYPRRVVFPWIETEQICLFGRRSGRVPVQVFQSSPSNSNLRSTLVVLIQFARVERLSSLSFMFSGNNYSVLLVSDFYDCYCKVFRVKESLSVLVHFFLFF